MKVYEAVARAAIEEGATALFTLMGDSNMEFAHFLEQGGAKIFHARHEGTAVAMADGFARATGSVGLCAVTAGPGLANTAVSVTGAARANAPIVVFTGPGARDDLQNPQAMDHEAFARLTGAGYVPITNAAGALELTKIAFYQAAAERRPVLLDIARDVQATEYPWGFEYTPARLERPDSQRIQPDPAMIARAVELIAGAQRPVVIAGEGVVASGARDAIVALAENLGALLATTLNVRGLFHGEAFDLGVAGLFSSPLAMELFAEADLVLAFGASLNHFTIEGGYLFPEAAVIHVDIRRETIMGNHVRADCYIQADARSAVDAIVANVGLESHRRAGYACDEIADRIATTPIDDKIYEIETGTIDPRVLCVALDEALPDPTGMVVGVGHFWSFPNMHMRRWREPQLNTIQFGAIGQALAVGIGAAAGAPDRPVVVLEGDASLMMNVQELETLARYRQRILLVVFNDWALGAEYHKLLAHDFNASLSLAPETDFASVARAFGCAAVTVTNCVEFESAIADFVAGDGPLVIDARVSRNVISMPYRRVVYGES